MPASSNEKTAKTGRAYADISPKRAYLRGKYAPGRLRGCAPADIKNVLVVQAASRSGSSFLYRLLAGRPGIISLNGEDMVFQKLAGIGEISSAQDSDSLPAGFDPGRPVLERIASDILLDSGNVHSGTGAYPAGNYAADCAQRFLLQWPGAGADPDELYRCAAASAGKMSETPGFDAQEAWASFLGLLAERGIAVDPWYYDLRPELVRRLFPRAEPPDGPPPGGGPEDTPFVIPEPRTFPGADRLGKETLLLKSSSDCYRAEFIRKLFPSARYRFVRLTRNPMAAISGLMDGWLSRGFFSRDLGAITELDIKGYSEPSKPWTRRWWKFDLPPGWEGYGDRSLAEVCAFQWVSANRRILDDSSSGLLGETISVKYEDLLRPETLESELARIAGFAGLPGGAAAAGLRAVPVMAVTPPRPHKWLKRKTELLPLAPGLTGISSELGYDLRNAELLP